MVGGSNRASAAPKTLRLHWGGDAPLDTDIDGTKNFIRDRTWFPLFVELHDLRVGDSVQLSRVNSYEYIASPIKSAHPVTKV